MIEHLYLSIYLRNIDPARLLFGVTNSFNDGLIYFWSKPIFEFRSHCAVRCGVACQCLQHYSKVMFRSHLNIILERNTNINLLHLPFTPSNQFTPNIVVLMNAHMGKKRAVIYKWLHSLLLSSKPIRKLISWWISSPINLLEPLWFLFFFSLVFSVIFSMIYLWIKPNDIEVFLGKLNSNPINLYLLSGPTQQKTTKSKEAQKNI